MKQLPLKYETELLTALRNPDILSSEYCKLITNSLLTPAPKRQQRGSSFRFVDLFAGIGGIRIPFDELGGECVFSSEWDKYSQLTYVANFGELPHGDIRSIDARLIPDHDILLAGFPCQAFSIAGVSKKNSLNRPHGFQDKTQGTLFFEVARILRERNPRAFLLENVKNLRTYDRGRTFDVIMKVLRRDLGYTVKEKILDARSFVPQHRERVYIVGFREPVDFEFPRVATEGPKLGSILDSVVDAKYTLTDHLWRYLQQYARKHAALGNGFGFGLTALDGVARTLSARYFKDGSEILVPQRGNNPRRLTPRECARLMGFPEEFKIVVSDTQAYKQFGNSVVVPAVRVIAQRMAECLFEQNQLLLRESSSRLSAAG
jgi:DNA (cytosine-5)-methyltransferase 1